MAAVWNTQCRQSAVSNNNNSRFTALFPGLPGCAAVSEETLTHPPSRSSCNLYQLLPSTTIHRILPAQITCLANFLHNLSPCPLWFRPTSWSEALHLIFHTFFHPINVFSQHMPYHRILFCSINVISSIPSLSTPYLKVGTLQCIFYLNITRPSDHSHLCSLKCHLRLIFFPNKPGLTSV